MNTIEDNLDNNTNNFKPTRELGDLVLYAAGKTFGANKMWDSMKIFTHFDDSTLWEIIDGTWTVKGDYIRLLSLCIRKIRPKKVKLKKLPATLPNRDVLESLENGLEADLSLYKKTITELLRMPDIPPKKHNTYKSGRIILYKGEDFRTSSIYRQISAQNNSFSNLSPSSSDFEYGLTDT